MSKTSLECLPVAPEDIHGAVDHCFKERRREMILVLVRRFGYGRLEEIEDALQAAAVKALSSWQDNGVPENQIASFVTVARNAIIDAGRQRTVAENKSPDVVRHLYDKREDESLWAGPLNDDVLKMMIVCTNPTLGQRDSATIILRGQFKIKLSDINRL